MGRAVSVWTEGRLRRGVGNTGVGVPVAFFVDGAGLVGDKGFVGYFFKTDHGGC